MKRNTEPNPYDQKRVPLQHPPRTDPAAWGARFEAMADQPDPAAPEHQRTVKLPETPQQWQNVVDAAEGALHLESARQFGLVTGGPAVNVERCEEMLALGRARGFTPAKDAVEKFVAGLMKVEGAWSSSAKCSFPTTDVEEP